MGLKQEFEAWRATVASQKVAVDVVKPYADGKLGKVYRAIPSALTAEVTTAIIYPIFRLTVCTSPEKIIEEEKKIKEFWENRKVSSVKNI